MKLRIKKNAFANNGALEKVNALKITKLKYKQTAIEMTVTHAIILLGSETQTFDYN